MLLKEGVQSLFILSRVFFLFIDDEGRVPENAVADGFYHPLEGLGVDHFDQNIFAVFPG